VYSYAYVFPRCVLVGAVSRVGIFPAQEPYIFPMRHIPNVCHGKARGLPRAFVANIVSGYSLLRWWFLEPAFARACVCVCVCVCACVCVCV